MHKSLIFPIIITLVFLGGISPKASAQTTTHLNAQVLIQQFAGSDASTTGIWSPATRLEVVRSAGLWRYGMGISSTNLAYLETAYQWTDASLFGGLQKRFGRLALYADAGLQTRWVPLQTNGPSTGGWVSSPIRRYDVFVRPGMSFRLTNSDHNPLSLSVAFEQGLLTVDPSDAGNGLSQRVRGVNWGLSLQL